MDNKNDFNDADFLLNELNQMKEQLKDIPKKNLQKLIDLELKEEKKAILELYEKEVSELPRDDPIKLEILNLMLWCGINPFDELNVKKLIDN
jgi:hypothetical protein